MSLLMEALRKAEEAKSKAAKENTEDAAPEAGTESGVTPAPEEQASAFDKSGATEQTSASAEPAITGSQTSPIETSEGAPSTEEDSDQEGPVVINPDPDEEETLAAHQETGNSQTEAQETLEFDEHLLDNIIRENSDTEDREADQGASADDDLEKIEFTTRSSEPEAAAQHILSESLEEAIRDSESVTPGSTPLTPTAQQHPVSEQDQPEEAEEAKVPSFLADDDNEDDLSLLQSSYFSRTKKPTSTFDDHESFPEESSTETDSPEPDSGAPGRGPSPFLEEDDYDSLSINSPASNETIAGTMPEEPASESAPTPAADDAGSDRAREMENRSSASSLFQAKEESRSRRRKRMMGLAAGLLIIPVAGIAWWFYSSMTSTPGMQFTVPTDGSLANRGMLGEGLQDQALSDAANQSPGETRDTALLADTSVQQDTPEGQTSVVETLDTGTQAEVPAEDQALIAQTPASPGVSETGESSAPLQAVTPPQDQIPPGSDIDEPTVSAGTEQLAQSTIQPTPQATAAQAETPAASSAPAQTGLSFVRRAAENVINPDLNAAYDSYTQGDFPTAGRLYQQVLSVEPNNRDAMLGLASVYLRQNAVSMSQRLYARLLELNPRDPIARAGLLESALLDDPLRQESELKSLISAYPGIAPLSFALGNLYASQNRWSEAQNAYFDALLAAKSAGQGNISPDYAFNLAVSLERLNQLQAALDYYREAEQFSRTTAPGFDPALLSQRLSYLEQRL